MTTKKSDQGSDKSSGNKSDYIDDFRKGGGDFRKGEVKPERYEKPTTRPAPSPKPPKKKDS